MSSGTAGRTADSAADRAAPRTPLSRERVLRAAIGLADAGGIEALSMRKLAKELGVEAMSLYNHVANKDEILRGILDAVASEAELPTDAADWKAAIRRSALSLRDVFLRHPWACELWMSRSSDGVARLRREDWMLRTLREAGLSPELTHHTLHIVESHLLGFTLQQLSFPVQGEDLADLATAFLAQLPTAEFPDFAEHVRQHLQPHYNDVDGFELGLDLILDGVDRLSDGRAPGS